VLLGLGTQDVSLIGLMGNLHLRIQPTPGIEPPDKIDFSLQYVSLFAQFEAPKNRQPVTIQTKLNSDDIRDFQMVPTENRLFENPALDTENLIVRMDGFRLQLPLQNGKYAITAKWRVLGKSVGQLELPVQVEIILPS
jgi:hypothetical protein